MSRNVIVGGGVIGLSLAFELVRRGHNVAVLERDRFGRKASWAGAGILTPANPATAIHPLEHLEALSNEVHEHWAGELQRKTGIDNGFRKCGGLYLARTAGEVAALNGMMADWEERGIHFELLDQETRRTRFDAFGCTDSPRGNVSIRRAIWVPGESQVSNPHHLKALVQACHQLGAEMNEQLGESTISLSGDRIESMNAAGQTFSGDNYFFTSGPWTEQLIEPTKVQLPMQPVRGQIVLYKIDAETALTIDWPIVNEGSRYLVPRSDGHVLAGATIEEAGFDCVTTPAEINDLRNWAESLCGMLGESTFVKSWAGLRPATYDGFPYLGQLGEIKNAFVATGHFKSGLHLSTGTALVMADLAEGKTPTIDLRPFRPSRAAGHQSIEKR